MTYFFFFYSKTRRSNHAAIGGCGVRDGRQRIQHPRHGEQKGGRPGFRNQGYERQGVIPREAGKCGQGAFCGQDGKQGEEETEGRRHVPVGDAIAGMGPDVAVCPYPLFTPFFSPRDNPKDVPVSNQPNHSLFLATSLALSVWPFTGNDAFSNSERTSFLHTLSRLVDAHTLKAVRLNNSKRGFVVAPRFCLWVVH